MRSASAGSDAGDRREHVGAGSVDVHLGRGRRFVGASVVVGPAAPRSVRTVSRAAAGYAARSRVHGELRAAGRDDDFVAVADVRRQVYGDQVGARARPAGEGERVLRTRVRANRVDARTHDLARDVHQRLRQR